MVTWDFLVRTVIIRRSRIISNIRRDFGNWFLCCWWHIDEEKFRLSPSQDLAARSKINENKESKWTVHPKSSFIPLKRSVSASESFTLILNDRPVWPFDRPLYVWNIIQLSFSGPSILSLGPTTFGFQTVFKKFSHDPAWGPFAKVNGPENRKWTAV